MEAKEFGERSFKAGYFKDAARYYRAAHEKDPGDFSVILKLAWTYNLLHEDDEAIAWFDRARKSPDAAISQEATQAWKGLRTDLAPFRITTWVFPLYSLRWKDLFSYGQVKTEFRLGHLPFRPYISLRFIGDTRNQTGGVEPQYLSETSLILGAGIASRPLAWGDLVG